MFVLMILSLLSVTVLAQPDPQVTEVARYLSGRRFLVSYREGGPVYGTHVVLDVQYCSNGQYLLRRTAVPSG